MQQAASAIILMVKSIPSGFGPLYPAQGRDRAPGDCEIPVAERCGRGQDRYSAFAYLSRTAPRAGWAEERQRIVGFQARHRDISRA